MSSPFPASLLVLALALAGCARETRDYHNTGSDQNRVRAYGGNAYHLAEGQRLFGWMNCNGCHANGGGGMGPALTDARWRYGGSMRDIVATILNGRPNGMPAFRNRITEDQAWELASYVRSLSSRTRKDILAGRADQPANIPPPSLNEPRGVIRVTPEEDVERRP